MITLTINGRKITIDRPMTVLEAARMAGIKIPTLCNHELLKPYGGCRLCVVEVERMLKLQNACTLPAADGMVVRTESEEITKVRRGILELLLINHPLDCPYCDKAGECELQDLVNKYGPTVGRYREEKRKVPESHRDQIFYRNMQRCVVCTRCVRMCADVQGAYAISVIGRGGRSRVEPFSAESFNCEYCGNCLTVCPVGAILSKLHMHSSRPWQMDREVETVCAYCGVGCSFSVQVRDETIQRVVPVPGKGINSGLLCVRGRFGYEFISSKERLKTPLIRRNGRLQQCTWSEAISFVAERLERIKKESGGSAIAGIGSPRCTNEDNYVFQKFMRVVCGTNNIDSLSRVGFASAQAFFEHLLGQGITANIIDGIKNSEAVLVLGGDPTTVNPILGLSVREASRRGAKVIVIGHAPGLKRFMSVHVVPQVFREAELLEALLAAISRDKGVRGEKPYIDARIKKIRESIAGDPAIEGFRDMKDALLKSGSTSIILGMNLIQRSNGYRSLFAIAGLTYLLEARLFLLSERPNEQGVIDMGCVPDMLPGGRPIGIYDFRKKYEEAWGAPVPPEDGLFLMEIIEGARDGRIKALYIMGENPVFNLPDSASIREALGRLDLLVVQDIFPTETAEMAHVVLPALGWAEKTGTYTNLERRIQLLRSAVSTSFGMDDWKIISEISAKMGYKMGYSCAEDIMDEIATVSPLHRDLTYREISRGKSIWPYHGEPLRDEVREMDLDRPVESGEYKGEFYLLPDRPLFHSGTISRRSIALNRIQPEPLLRIGSATAEKLNIREGDQVLIKTEKGGCRVRVTVDEHIRDNTVYLSNNFPDRGVFSLLKYKLDPVTKAPGIEGCEVDIKRV